MHELTPLQKRIAYALISVTVVLVAAVSAGFVMLYTGTLHYHSETTLQPDQAATTTDDLRAPESPFLGEEEVIVIVTPATTTDGADQEEILPVEKVTFEYIEIIESCGVHFEGECVLARSGPGTEFEVVKHLRNNVVLKVDGQVERDGRWWYKIVFDEVLHYPERVTGDWFVSSEYVRVLRDEGTLTIWEDGTSSTSKRIVIDRSEQRLYAYEGDKLFMQVPISTGVSLTPTPRGTFTVFKKTPSRYMQGPLPDFPADQYYDLPGVPWNLYFTHEGAVIHGAYWHNSFGSPYSHGCVNLPTNEARILYKWAELGMEVVVQD